MRPVMRPAIVSIALASLLGMGAAARAPVGTADPQANGGTCSGDNGGITLSPGFCATVFADNLGHVRHIAVAPDGAVYVNIWSGRYYPRSPVPADGFLIALKDSNGDGTADIVKRFGATAAEGSDGGTGIAVHNGFLYAEVNDRIVRFRLTPGTLVPTGKAETVVSGMPLGGDHPMHPFVIDAKGQMFIDMGSSSNSCQPKNRVAGVAGAMPCTETETRGGLWRYDASKLDQKFSSKERYATGIRNGEGLAFDRAGRLFSTQHGRDQLLQNWPALYPDATRTTELPAEELMLIKAGGDYGWPTCYYDGFQKKLVLAPEYGGDGGKAVGACAGKLGPVAAYPAHWAPNALAIYNHKALPAPYQDGAFIAFHGSWNRAPAPQDGYNVTFQPLRNGAAAGPYVIFANGFAGNAKDPGKAIFRPMGLAVAPDGALFITDDVKGRIWRVTYHGGPITAVASAPEPMAARSPPPTFETKLSSGVPTAQVALGRKLYNAGTCSGCHGADARGTPLGPDLTASTRLWSDGSVAGIAAVITNGVPQPKQYRGAMPAMGGSQLSPDEVNALASYVAAAAHGAK